MSWATAGGALLGLTLFFSTPVHADERIPLNCPKQIEATVSLKRPLEGWKPVAQPITYTLETVTFYDGHPKEKASLPPDEDEFGPDNSVYWSHRMLGDNAWVTCEYGGISLSLAKKLPKGVKLCKAFYKPEVQGKPVEIVDAYCELSSTAPAAPKQKKR